MIPDFLLLRFERAQSFRRELESEIAQYFAGNPWSIVEEVDEKGILNHVLRIHEPIPNSISLPLADLLSNLGAVLDGAVYERILRERPFVSEAEARSSQFPVCSTLKSFSKFVGHKNRKLWPMGLKEDLLHLQPFSLWRDAYHQYEESLSNTDPLFRLSRLNNIHKHRVRAVLVESLDSVWYSSGAELPEMSFQFAHDEITDGATVFKTQGRAAGQTHLNSAFALSIAADPAHQFSRPTDLKAELRHSVDGFLGAVWHALSFLFPGAKPSGEMPSSKG